MPRVGTVCPLDLAYPRAQRFHAHRVQRTARSGRSAVVHLLPRSSRQRNAAPGGVRVRSRVRSRRGTQPCTPAVAGHVALGGFQRPTRPRRLPVRRTVGCRHTIIPRTPVRSQPSTRPPSRLIRLINSYQRAAEGKPSPCRFTPSCSAYAKEALELHGRRRGLWLALRRIIRCRPFGPSGWDPVPIPRTRRAFGERFLTLTTSSRLVNDKGHT